MTAENVQQGSPSRIDMAAFTDLIVILTVLIGVKQAVLPFSLLYAGPASTFSAMIVATYMLRRRHLSWGELGLVWPNSWLKTAGLTAFTFFCFAMIVGMADDVISSVVEETGTSGRFGHVEGNLVAYIGMMVLVWTHGSFFEELLFRAFIMNRTSTFLGGGWKADIAALLFSTIFFGYRHYYYKGLHGALTTGVAGLVFGVMYLWFGRRNILPLMFTHGIINSVGQTLRFLGMKTD